MHSTFENGWGVSVIDFGYGADRGLFELAVIGPNGDLHYKNPVARGDVRGWLNAQEVTELSHQVEKFGLVDNVEAAYVTD